MSASILHDILQGRRRALTYTHSILELKSGHQVATELLTRFEGDDGRMRTVGHLLDDVTLSSAHRVELDLLCVGAVFESLAETPISDRLLFINLHPLTLASPMFWQKLRPWLWDLSIPPHRIVLEITEEFGSLSLDDLEVHAQRLRRMELRIAVDDLGNGVASLAHMARLAPDFIKVDRSLVHQAHRRPYQAALLNALSVFASRMGVGYIAEGIETREELQAILDADVPWGQGFLFGEPTPLGTAVVNP
ncbi:MAG: EAL domain-containing protein [Firmicutes bacterium]|nr:EAL domain-containing protein [Bacillota bacterium]